MAVVMTTGPYLARLQAAAAEGFGKAGETIAARVRKSLNRPNRDGDNPSDPGEAPKRQTGELRESIRSVPFRDGSIVGVRVGSDRIEARILELGHMSRDAAGLAHRAARPFLRPQLVSGKATVRRIVVREIRARLKG